MSSIGAEYHPLAECEAMRAAPKEYCSDMYVQGISMIRVRYDVPNPDPHRFDGTDNDGWGCEG